MEKVLIVSAHPDDEVLGCGGLMIRNREKNVEQAWLIATTMDPKDGFDASRIEKRQAEITEIEQRIGFKKTYNLGLPAAKLDAQPIDSLIKLVSSAINDFKPSSIYLPNRSDVHSDHRILFSAVWACTKSFRYPFVKKVAMYECISETEFAPALAEDLFCPNLFVDISNCLEEKLKLMQIYGSELGTHPFPRNLKNIEALALFRGATAGIQYAEAFHLLKLVE